MFVNSIKILHLKQPYHFFFTISLAVDFINPTFLTFKAIRLNSDTFWVIYNFSAFLCFKSIIWSNKWLFFSFIKHMYLLRFSFVPFFANFSDDGEWYWRSIIHFTSNNGHRFKIQLLWFNYVSTRTSRHAEI